MTAASPQIGVLALTATLVVGTVGATLWWLKNRSAKYLKVAKVKRIFIYPIKSIMGLEITTAHCTVEGPVYDLLKDRTMMLVKGDYFVSQREEPSLALVQMTYKDGKLTLTADAMKPLVVDAVDPDASSKPYFMVKVRGNEYKAVQVSPEGTKWFRQFLKQDDIRLVRILQDDENIARGARGAMPVAFQDSASFHVCSVESLKDLNSRKPEGDGVEITERNFRPNFLVEGCDAFAEDHWTRIKLGDAEISFLERCTRCILTTVNPDTGIQLREPLKTLRTYRLDRSDIGKKKYKLHPLFGVRQFLLKDGHVSVGDDVYAVSSAKPLL